MFHYQKIYSTEICKCLVYFPPLTSKILLVDKMEGVVSTLYKLELSIFSIVCALPNLTLLLLNLLPFCSLGNIKDRQSHLTLFLPKHTWHFILICRQNKFYNVLTCSESLNP